MNLTANNHTTKDSQYSEWFDNIVASLRAKELELKAGVAKKEDIDFYSGLMSGDVLAPFKQIKLSMQQLMVRKLLEDYLTIIKVKPKELAFHYNDNEVLIWAVIEDDQEELERDLILTEAKINSKYHEFGYDMNSTIVEESDNLPIPNHYIKY